MSVWYSGISAFILYSVILGFCLGGVYDLFRLIRMVVCVPEILGTARKGRSLKSAVGVNVIVFICDILFFIVAACISAIFIFHANNGNIRGIALFGSLAGFVIYYNTVGRLVTKLSAFIIRGVYRVLMFLFLKILLPIARGVFYALVKLFGALAAVVRRNRSRRIRRSLLRAAQGGYGIFKAAEKMLRRDVEP